GYTPTTIRNNDFWYKSPLRDERVASFKINRKLNKWFDYGLGEGGNLIDFAIRLHHCSVSELLANFQSIKSLTKNKVVYPPNMHKPESKLEIKAIHNLRSEWLLKYLQERKISIQIADQYCKEITYKIHLKTYKGIGFQNDSAGYEIRTPRFKCSTAPKAFSSIINGSDKVSVFEGFMDFLTYRTLLENQDMEQMDFIILNSISFFEKARSTMEQYDKILLYLDRDSAGVNMTKYALALNACYIDKSFLYQNCKDLNEWAILTQRKNKF
ncbi:MAG: toprim domain-containing protein, partial [Sphingobacterium sp.]